MDYGRKYKEGAHQADEDQQETANGGLDAPADNQKVIQSGNGHRHVEASGIRDEVIGLTVEVVRRENGCCRIYQECQDQKMP